VNASACGVLQTARIHPDEIGKVCAGRNGIIGALTEDLILINTSIESEAAIAALKYTPGTAFGLCHYKLASIDQHRAQYERLIEVFQAHRLLFLRAARGEVPCDQHSRDGARPYRAVQHKPVVLPPRVHNPEYHRGPIPKEMYVPAIY
jgi:hypothetical protein